MEQDSKINLLAKVARTTMPQDGVPEGSTGMSILTLAAASYGARPNDDATVPTGFDPNAAKLFEAIMEGAYLVASADGVFDATERATFEKVLWVACGGVVAESEIGALVADFADQLAEDGLDRRVAAVGEQIQKRSHALEVLRIAALLAQTSEDVSDVERTVLNKIAKACGLDEPAVDTALADVRSALAGAGSRPPPAASS